MSEQNFECDCHGKSLSECDNQHQINMTAIAKEIYNVLNELISPDNYNHIDHTGMMDLLITGKDLNNALDILKKYKWITFIDKGKII